MSRDCRPSMAESFFGKKRKNLYRHKQKKNKKKKTEAFQNDGFLSVSILFKNLIALLGFKAKIKYPLQTFHKAALSKIS